MSSVQVGLWGKRSFILFCAQSNMLLEHAPSASPPRGQSSISASWLTLTSTFTTNFYIWHVLNKLRSFHTRKGVH